MPHSQTKLEEVKTRRQKKKKQKAQILTYTYIYIYRYTHIVLIKIDKPCSSMFMIKLTFVAGSGVTQADHLI